MKFIQSFNNQSQSYPLGIWVQEGTFLQILFKISMDRNSATVEECWDPNGYILLFAHAKLDSESIMTYYGLHVPSAQGWERESVPKSWTIFGSCSFKRLRGKGAIKYVWYLTTGLFNLFCRRARFGKKCQGLLHNICIYSIVYIPFKICYLDVIKQWTFSV